MLGSNTFGLYRQGWSGITIDPVSTNVEFAGKCQPRDTSVKAVVGSTNEEKQFYEYEIYEFSTTEMDRVNNLSAQGIHPIRTYLMKSIDHLLHRGEIESPYSLSNWPKFIFLKQANV